jgi:HlyD family secretion protein
MRCLANPKIIIPLLVLGLGIGAYFGWQYIADVKLQEDREFLTLYGNIEIRRVNLSFRVSGRITGILYKEGDKIEKDAVIARLDREPFENNFAVAQAQVRTAEINYEKLKTGNRPQEIEQARATLQQWEATLKVLQSDYERTNILLERKTVTQQEYDSAVARRDEAVAAKKLAAETLNLLLEGFRQEEIAMGESQLAEAKANLKRLQTSLDDTELKCPNDGILLTRVEEVGAVVNPGQTIATLSLRDEVWAYVYVPEKIFGLVTPGMTAEIYSDSFPERPYAGQVGYISPEAEFTPKTVQTTELRSDLVYRVRIIVNTPGNGLRQGMPVTVKLHLGR